MTKLESVEDVLAALDIQIATVRGNEIAAHCPFHADRHPSFSINSESGAWICFQCGEKGSLEHLIQKVKEGVNPKLLLRSLRERSIGQRSRAPEEVSEEPQVDPMLVFAMYEAFKYPPRWAMQDRFISREAVERYGIKWDRGWVIPVWAPNVNKLWGWQFKRLDYVRNYPVGIKKSRTLFGLREAQGTTGILVESPLDVVRMASVGIEGGVASYGAMVSGVQRQLLVERFDRLVVALDNDREGKRQGKKIFKDLNRLVPTERFVYTVDVKDIGEFEDDELVEALDVSR